MSEWRDRLADVDDEYLIGLSNKGIVKRAYKDKEEVPAGIVALAEEASVTVGEETVTVRFPLGESKCTCPSRSMCRHIVQAILVLKESCMKEGGAGNVGGEGAGTEAGGVGESGTEAGRIEESGAEKGGTEGQKAADPQEVLSGKAAAPVEAQCGGNTANAGAQGGGDSTASVEQSNGDDTAESVKAYGADNADGKTQQRGSSVAEKQSPNEKKQTALIKEIKEYPFEKLKKTLGTRGFQTFVNQVTAKLNPDIRYSSVIMVKLPEYTVKLLSPLEYSTCTCHKKELCVHKASAILWCQLEAGILTGEKLLGEIGASGQSIDMEKGKEAAGQMKAYLEELFGTGLSRTSEDVPEDLERLAVISHNAGLARFEGYFRTLADAYGKYFKRNAALKTEDLMAQMTRLYRRVTLLSQAEDAGAVMKLAGEFRADYLPVGNLDLIGIGMERFQNQAGYAGETIYFLEENTGKWYTYTNARPMFYDSGRRGRFTEKGQAPWGINTTTENLLNLRIHLTGAKCDDRMRLSSSQETRGEITGEQRLCTSDVKGWYYRDFGKLFQEQIGKQQTGWLFEQSGSGEEASDGDGGSGGGSARRGMELVFVRPASCAKAEFSQTGQQLTLPLYDQAGREVLVEVTYSKQESSTIRYLERISEKKLPCFLGKLYLRDGRLRMYPVDLPEVEEDEETITVDREPGIGPEDASQDRQKEDADPMAVRWGNVQERDAEIDSQAGPAVLGRKPKYQVVEEIAEEVKSLMEDLYQSGFYTVHDSTLKDIGKAAELTENYGMKYLSEQLSELSREITAGRHRMKRQNGRMAELYTDINEYLYLCRQKTAYDRGWDYYKSE